MNNRIFFIFLFITVTFLSSKAQTVIKIPFVQPDKFVVLPQSVYKSFESNLTINLGLEVEILGGSGNYTFSWIYEGLEIGTDPTITITQRGTYTLTVDDGVGCKSTVNYFVDPSSGLENLYEETTTIFPNPTDGHFYIQSKEINNLDKVEIRSLTGEIYGSYLKKDQVDKIQLDASGLSSGYYFVVSHFGATRITKALIRK